MIVMLRNPLLHPAWDPVFMLGSNAILYYQIPGQWASDPITSYLSITAEHYIQETPRP